MIYDKESPFHPKLYKSKYDVTRGSKAETIEGLISSYFEKEQVAQKNRFSPLCRGVPSRDGHRFRVRQRLQEIRQRRDKSATTDPATGRPLFRPEINPPRTRHREEERMVSNIGEDLYNRYQRRRNARAALLRKLDEDATVRCLVQGGSGAMPRRFAGPRYRSELTEMFLDAPRSGAIRGTPSNNRRSWSTRCSGSVFRISSQFCPPP